MPFALSPETGFSMDRASMTLPPTSFLSGAGGNTATKTEQAERLILDLLADGKELASEEIVKAEPKPEYLKGRCRTPSATWAVFWMQGASAVNGTTSSKEAAARTRKLKTQSADPLRFALSRFHFDCASITQNST